MPEHASKKKSSNLRRLAIFLAGAVVGAAVCYLLQSMRHETGLFSANRHRDQQTAAAAPHPWAQPMSLPGLPNLHQVSDRLYRGAQPNAEGMRQLQKLGVKTVVNLRSYHSDRDELAGTALTCEPIPMKASRPQTEDVVRFLKTVTDPKNTPVFVHCQHGADRTGTMCAAYRVVVQGWSKQDAIEEMTKGGFGFHGFWDELGDFILALDVEAIKKQLKAP